METSNDHDTPSVKDPQNELQKVEEGGSKSEHSKYSVVHEDLSFPWRLYNLLQVEMFEDIIAWVPDGTAFVIVNEQQLIGKILPKFFPKMSKMKSFKRQLSAYGFSYIRSGKHSGAYQNSNFLREDKDKCSRLERKKSFQRRPEARNTTGIAAQEPPSSKNIPDFVMASIGEAKHNQSSTMAHLQMFARTAYNMNFVATTSLTGNAARRQPNTIGSISQCHQTGIRGSEATMLQEQKDERTSGVPLYFGNMARHSLIHPQHSHFVASKPFDLSSLPLFLHQQGDATEVFDYNAFRGSSFETKPLQYLIGSSTSTSQQGSVGNPVSHDTSAKHDQWFESYINENFSMEPRTIEEMITQNSKDP
ncbi:HSF-type DNA-binding protein [Nitzschia inconspicua]|uniref:HSF-type DNA-binding protein n=1 Tax=Nitzschia inconspicua TaxID=303405 RepID=A0A9K3M3R4_9STRA|nr:HSF-type DNA-binding protein [Nitzschia inconspicua]